MFKLKTFARSFLIAGFIAVAALPAAAQFQVANSTSGSQANAAPINLAVLQAGINNAQNTANVANNQANYATQVGNNAQSTANWAGGVAQGAQNTANWAGDVAGNAQNTANNAQSTANAIAGRVDRTWELAMATCALTMGGNRLWCEMTNPRGW